MESQTTTANDSHLFKTLSDNAQIGSHFIGTDGGTLKIQTTNAQELYNHYQYFKNDQILVIDFRTK